MAYRYEMKDFTAGNVTQQILSFSVPMVLATLVQNLFNVVDSIVVGRFIGKEALAAVGASFPVIFTLISLIIGVGSGATTVIAQYFGARDLKNVSKTIDTIFIFFFLSSIIVSIAGIASSKLIFKLMRLPLEIVPDALTYMNIYMGGMFLLFGVSGIGAILRGVGDSRTPLVIVAVAALLNTILDLVFVVVLGWGIASVAYATLIANGTALTGTIWYLNKSHPLVRFSILNMSFDRQIFKSYVKIGLPTGLQQSFVSLGMLAVMGIVTSFGTNAVAAYTATLRIDSFAKTPSFAFSSALSSFTGQNIGANQPGRIKEGLRSTMIISVAYSLFITLLILLFGQAMMSLFTTDPDVIAIGQEYLIIVTSFYILFAALFTYTGLLRGAGATFVPMVVTMITLWVIRVPLSVLLSSLMGVNGIWWALPVSWVIGLLATWIYYLSGRWKNKRVVNTGKIG